MRNSGLREPVDTVGSGVAVIADNEGIHAYMVDEAKEAGFEVLAFYNGQGAVDAIRRVRPRVVLTDYKLPGDVDGIGIAQEALRQGVMSVEIFTSTPGIADRAKAAGLDGVPVHGKDFRLISERIRGLANGLLV